MKNTILLLILGNFIFTNTFYTSDTFTGMITKKGKSAFGMSINYSNFESYFNPISLLETDQEQAQEVEEYRRSNLFKSLNIEYMTKIGVEIGLSAGSENQDQHIVENITLAYHFKGKNNKFNGLMSFKKSHIEDKINETNDFFETLSFGFYTGNGFYFKLDHLAFDDGILFNAVEDEATFGFITLGKIWKKGIGIFGLSYTGKLSEDDNEDTNEVFKQGDLTLTLGFTI